MDERPCLLPMDFSRRSGNHPDGVPLHIFFGDFKYHGRNIRSNSFDLAVFSLFSRSNEFDRISVQGNILEDSVHMAACLDRPAAAGR